MTMKITMAVIVALFLSLECFATPLTISYRYISPQELKIYLATYKKTLGKMPASVQVIAERDQSFRVKTNGLDFTMLHILSASDNNALQCAIAFFDQNGSYLGSVNPVGAENNWFLCSYSDQITFSDIDHNGILDIGMIYGAATYKEKDSVVTSPIVLSWEKNAKLPMLNKHLTSYFGLAKINSVDDMVNPKKSWYSKRLEDYLGSSDTKKYVTSIQNLLSGRFDKKMDIYYDNANSFYAVGLLDELYLTSFVLKKAAVGNASSSCYMVFSSPDQNVQSTNEVSGACSEIISLAFSDLDKDGNIDIPVIYRSLGKNSNKQYDVVVFTKNKSDEVVLNQRLTDYFMSVEHNTILDIKKAAKRLSRVL